MNNHNIIVDGRIPTKIDDNFRFGLLQVLRDIANQVNEVTDIVMETATHSTSITSDTLVKTGAGKFKGYVVNVVTAAGTIDIRDSITAGGGTIIETIPAGKAVGRYETNRPWLFETGIYVDYNAGPATGTLVILYE
jgi:hypothetical protein